MSITESFPALKYKNFRYFISGQGISLIGTWMQRVAQQWVIYEMTKSPVILGLIGVFQYTPMLLLSLFSGSIINRFPKKKFLVTMQILQAVQALILSFLIWTNLAKPWHILLMAGILGTIGAFDMPARQSFFMDLVGKDSLHSAIALNSTIVNIGKIVGPAIGGIFLANYGATICFLFNGLSFIGVIYGLIKIENIKDYKKDNRKNILKETYEGLKYIKNQSKIMGALVSLFVISTIAMNNEVVLPVLARETLNLGSKGFSMLYSALGFGSLIGALRNASRKSANLSLKTLFNSGIIIGLALLSLSFSKSLTLSLLILVVMGYFLVMFMNICSTIIQLDSEEKFRVRTISIYTLVFTGSTPLGNFTIGTILEYLGMKLALFIMGLSVFIFIYIIKKYFNDKKRMKI